MHWHTDWNPLRLQTGVSDTQKSNRKLEFEIEILKINVKLPCNLTSYELQNTTKCIEIDECEIFGICSQLCINEIGAYKVNSAPKKMF